MEIQHQVRRGLTHEEGPLEVDIHEEVVAFLGRLQYIQAHAGRHAGVVDMDVQPAVPLPYLRGEPAAVFLPADITPEIRGLDPPLAQAVDDRHGFLRVDDVRQ